MTPCKNRKDKRRKAKDQRIKTTGGKIPTSIRGNVFPLINLSLICYPELFFPHPSGERVRVRVAFPQKILFPKLPLPLSLPPGEGEKNREKIRFPIKDFGNDGEGGCLIKNFRHDG